MKNQIALPGPSSKATLYTSLDGLPLLHFERCVCDSDLSALVISGTPTEEELLSAWEEISAQYSDAVGGAEHKRFFALTREVTRLQIKYNQILCCISILREVGYVKLFADKLNKLLRASFTFDITNISQYDSELDRCVTRSKSVLMELQLKEAELEGLRKSNGAEEVRYTRQYFTKILINLSDHAGYKLKKEDLTTFEYCERLNRYQEYIKHLQNQKSNPTQHHGRR